MKIFKPYTPGQKMLLPPDLEEMIPVGHRVRVVNAVVDRMDLKTLEAQFKGGGATAYHPRMMVKVLVYAYMEGVCTSRKIAKALRENIHFMWLSGMQRPDFRTVALFRRGRLKEEIKTVFAGVVHVAEEMGLVDGTTVFVDGTKMGANANRHRIVWRKTVAKRQERLEEQIEARWQEIEALEAEEEGKYGKRDLPETGEGQDLREQEVKIEEAVARVNARLKKQAEAREAKERKAWERKKRKLDKELRTLQEKKAKTVADQEALGKRSGMSATDPGAGPMMFKGEGFKPGYTVMIATQNQIILGYQVTQQTNDGTCFIPLMEELKGIQGKAPERVGGDSAFGNEENYVYCEEEGMEAYLKYGMFHHEGTKAHREDRYHKNHFVYDPEQDSYRCPEEQILSFDHGEERVTATGYKQTSRVYRGQACGVCAQKLECCKGQARTITRNENWERLRTAARKRLRSAAGKQMRKRRGVEVETAFGDMKHNDGWRRFLLRGLPKTTIEAGLHGMAHNLKKIAIHLLKTLYSNPFLKPTKLLLRDKELQGTFYSNQDRFSFI
jgi:transposase